MMIILIQLLVLREQRQRIRQGEEQVDPRAPDGNEEARATESLHEGEQIVQVCPKKE